MVKENISSVSTKTKENLRRTEKIFKKPRMFFFSGETELRQSLYLKIPQKSFILFSRENLSNFCLDRRETGARKPFFSQWKAHLRMLYGIHQFKLGGNGYIPALSSKQCSSNWSTGFLLAFLGSKQCFQHRETNSKHAINNSKQLYTNVATAL